MNLFSFSHHLFMCNDCCKRHTCEFTVKTLGRPSFGWLAGRSHRRLIRVKPQSLDVGAGARRTLQDDSVNSCANSRTLSAAQAKHRLAIKAHYLFFFIIVLYNEARDIFDASVILKCLHGRKRKSLVPHQRGAPGAVRLRHARSDKRPSESLVRGGP